MGLPYVWKVTKYDPRDWNADGTYGGPQEEVSDRGPLEAAYLQALADFAADSGVTHLEVRNPGVFPRHDETGAGRQVLEDVFGPDLAGLYDGATVDIAQAQRLVQVMLREEGLHCSLEAEGRFVVHLGWDQYMYLSSHRACEDAVARTAAAGLFPVRLPASPYEPDEDDFLQVPADEAFWQRLDDLVLDRGEVLIEEDHHSGLGDTIFHRLTSQDLPSAALQSRLHPRAMLSVHPALERDIAAVAARAAAAVADDDVSFLVWTDAEGRLHQHLLREEDADVEGRLRDARTAAWKPFGRDVLDPTTKPLLEAALPDPDGILRARWHHMPE
ncbi:hypothetical protein CLV92_11695 [Kineococcus xinjiangensis]|uniref:Uncharacterized protein n=1 Tax=Kineococcus xinjiangensis TaxID=512762 RepID=A0A2S6IDI2_9ACTN|nr:RNA-binding protein [Kineococcus xinjiangensis]PPK92233.1 hypothetical protein CLV92_11695 [Kineococcus xinjiangensis]